MYLRSYRPTDFEAIFALDVLCFAPRFRFSKSTMRAVVSTKESRVQLACEEDAGASETILGFCAVTLEMMQGAYVGYVSTLDVHPNVRRGGIGRALMTALEGEIGHLDIRRMALHVWEANAAALRLYESLGYRRVARAPAFYGAGYDAWLYSKAIPAATAIEAG